MNNYQAQGRARMCRKTFAIAEDLGRRLCDAKKRVTADGLHSMYQRSSKTGSIMDQTGTPNRRRGSSIPYKRSPLSRKMRSPGFPPPGDGGKWNLTGVMFGVRPFMCN